MLSYGLDGLYVLIIFIVPSSEPRQRSCPVRSQQTAKILPPVFEWLWSSSTFFELDSIESTQRFCSLLNVQIRTMHYFPLLTILSSWAQLWSPYSYSISHFQYNTSYHPFIRFLWLEPTAKELPSGDHLQQRAARLIFNTTRVGIHFPFSNVHTYALQSSEHESRRL